MRAIFLAVSLLAFVPAIRAQEAIVLQERLGPGSLYRVSTRSDLKGELQLPADDGRPAQSVKMTGRGAIDYDERVLPCDGKQADQKTIRHYRIIEFRRLMGDRPQEISLRPEVRRLVVMKRNHTKMPFSPDGPLSWGELDMLRTDIFVPSLSGLLPGRAVKPGDTWEVGHAAVRELTDIEKIERGSLIAKFETEETIGNRQVAHITLSGELVGVNEDGPNRQKLAGRLYFDRAGSFISYLSINGEHYLLDKDGRENGKISGEFVMVRSLTPFDKSLSDATLDTISFEPNADNTRLLFDERELGVRLLYPRRWRVGRVARGQITLDEANGSGLLITIEPASRVPAAQEYIKEAQGFLSKQQAKIFQISQPARLANSPAELDQFAIEAEVAGQRVTMDYLLARQLEGGATFAARLLQPDRDALMKEVEQMARSLVVRPKPRDK